MSNKKPTKAERRTAKRESEKQRKELINDWYRRYKAQLKCCICGERRPEALEHHHLDPTIKSFNVYVGVKRGFSLKRLEHELAKCAILCSNHHKLLHYGNLTKKEAIKWNNYLALRRELEKNNEPVFVHVDLKPDNDKKRVRRKTTKK